MNFYHKYKQALMDTLPKQTSFFKRELSFHQSKELISATLISNSSMDILKQELVCHQHSGQLLLHSLVSGNKQFCKRESQNPDSPQLKILYTFNSENLFHQIKLVNEHNF